MYAQPAYGYQPQPVYQPQPQYVTATPVVQPGMVMAQPGYPSPAPMVVAQPAMVVASPMMASPMMLNWMPLPPSIPGVPPGLEYLSMLDMIVVNQCMEIIEILTDWETANRYSLRNRFGQQIYFAAEESDCCSRQNCGSSRGFTIHVVDNFRREVIRIQRPYKCCSNGCSCCASCCGCCADLCIIESPPGVVVGSVVQRSSCLSYAFWIKDATGQIVFMVDGSDCICCGYLDKEFPIYTLNGVRVGAITKKFGGLAKELFTDADTFHVTFPQDLDVRLKAVILGATFLLDFVAFEEKHNNNPHY